jgi:Fe-S-cluster containining protein
MTTRLDGLLDELAQAADGKRHLPVVRAHDVEAVLALFNAQIDLGTEARAKQTAANGRPIACSAGCDACCHSLPGIHTGEAITIARWLARPEQDALRDAFLARFDPWRAALGDVVDRWTAASAANDVDAGMAAAREALARGVPCAFLDAGRCSIYAVRPVVCREHHAVGTSAACQPGAGTRVERASFPPLEAYLAKIQPILLALHDALRPELPAARSLCQAVHDELETLVAD